MPVYKVENIVEGTEYDKRVQDSKCIENFVDIVIPILRDFKVYPKFERVRFY